MPFRNELLGKTNINNNLFSGIICFLIYGLFIICIDWFRLAKKGKMPVTHTPTYPVVDPDPSMGKAFANFRLKDYGAIGVATATGFCTGWFGGEFSFYFISFCHAFLS